eukprot:TRINITY_DN8965_c2_g1_i1.p1 TRINITY_DN8965_c2_g1~~TRINITY_DN8965_c2_g1_i1.p1  ORF type:complete len:387 (+),score=65.58 TRINITY_DN8965_c2_g1_i1:68-1162(+)
MATAQVINTHHEPWYHGPHHGYHPNHPRGGYEQGYHHAPPPPPPPQAAMIPGGKPAGPDYHPLGQEFHFHAQDGSGFKGYHHPPQMAPPQRRFGYNGNRRVQARGPAVQPIPQQQQQQPHFNKWGQNQEMHVPSIELLAAEVGVDDPRVKTAAWRAVVVEVKFKRRDNALYWYRTALKPGEVVLVSADRGFDIGTVVATTTTGNGGDEPQETGKGQHSIVFRPSTPKETAAWLDLQATQEVQAVAKASEILENITTPELQDISFVDAVFQFDGRKLTLFYVTSSTDYKNYRPLLKPLFDTFGCRIWLQKVTTDETQDGDEAPQGAPRSHSEECETEESQAVESSPESEVQHEEDARSGTAGSEE